MNAQAAAEAQDMHRIWKRLKLDPEKLTPVQGLKGVYDYDGNVWWDKLELGDKFTKLADLPIRLRNVSGLFSCSGNRLTSLAGAPERVGRDFNCSQNRLTSLAGAPAHVHGDFMCTYNFLGHNPKKPKGVVGEFYCGAQYQGGPKPTQAATEPSTASVPAHAVLKMLLAKSRMSAHVPGGCDVAFAKDGDTASVRATVTLLGRKYAPKVFVLVDLDVRKHEVPPGPSQICVFAEYGRPDSIAGVCHKNIGGVVCSAGKSAAAVVKELLIVMLRSINKNIASSLQHAQAAAEADPSKRKPLSPNACLVDLRQKFKGKEVQKQFEEYTVTITSLASLYIKITVWTEQWKRDGFHYFDTYIGTSRSIRGTYPAVFDFSNSKKVVGDIHQRVSTPEELLSNAVKLTIKAGEKEYKAWLRLKKRAEKMNEAQAASEPVSPGHMYAFTLYADHEDASKVRKVLKLAQLEHVRAAYGKSSIYRMLVPKSNAVSELARAMLSNSGAQLWLCKPERCGLAAGAIDLNLDSSSIADVKLAAELAPMFMKHLVMHDVTASASSWFVVDVEEKNVEDFESAFAGVPLEHAGSLDVRGSKLLSFKVAAEPGAVVAAAAFAVSARTDTDQDPQLVFASESWARKLPEFMQAHSRFWCTELS